MKKNTMENAINEILDNVGNIPAKQDIQNIQDIHDRQNINDIQNIQDIQKKPEK